VSTKGGNLSERQRTDSKYSRTLLIEAAWHYSYGNKLNSSRIGTGSKLEQEYINYVRHADRRLKNKMYKVFYIQKRPKNVAATAVARELAGFSWGMMTGQIKYS